MKTIGIIGCRCRDSKVDLRETYICFNSVYEEGDKIVSGHCKQGGDRFAEIIADDLGLTEENGKLILHRPNWDKHGYSAGFVRNTYIAEDSDVIIAVIQKDEDPFFGGTGDTINKAIKLFGKDIDKDIILVPQIPVEDFDPLEEI